MTAVLTAPTQRPPSAVRLVVFSSFSDDVTAATADEEMEEERLSGVRAESDIYSSNEKTFFCLFFGIFLKLLSFKERVC